ncbi:hypothetical protein CD798_14975 [Bacillaceae bacterium SAOS 7]|nr:hypothetical protein CD798_14975 [Bacillaceae bacterium SAOS 7]
MRITLVTLLTFWALNTFPIFVHAKEDSIKIVQEFKPPNSLLISPEKPTPASSIQLYDFDQDGQNEIIFTFEIKANEQPSPSQIGAMILKKKKTSWQKIREIKTQGVGLDFSGLADITGDGTKEYLFGVTRGAAIGSNLEILQWTNYSLQKIADAPYHIMDIVIKNKKIGIATWNMYIGDSYLVDVLKWNGERLVYNKALYLKYYPTIEKFYKEKISKMNAWFYWYCLADAQIKANKLEEASKSIQKGRFLAEKLPLPDAVHLFNELNHVLKEKQMSVSL